MTLKEIDRFGLWLAFTLVLCFASFTAGRVYGQEYDPCGSWCESPKHEEYTIKDNYGRRTGKIVTDHVGGGYKIQDTYGVTRGRIESNDSDFFNSDSYKVERNR